jgi:hypothetical protein
MHKSKTENCGITVFVFLIIFEDRGKSRILNTAPAGGGESVLLLEGSSILHRICECTWSVCFIGLRKGWS